MRDIDLETRFVFSLGKPLSQSYAQFVHNHLFETRDMNYCYIRVETTETDLKDVLCGLKHMNCAGFSVTKPNKVAVVQYLDEVDKSVEIMGSCNTIRVENGKMTGFNTDASGFIKATEKAGIPVKNGRYVIYGAGGAGRACCIELAHMGAEYIGIVDCNGEKASNVVNEINNRFGKISEAVSANDLCGQKSALKNAGLVANMTGLGMYKSIDKSPIDVSMINNNAFYFDATYNPRKTKFLADAEATGHKIMNGLEMMLELSAEQFRIWTAMTVSINEFKDFIIKKVY